MGCNYSMEAADIFTPCAELVTRLGLREQMNKPGVMQQIRLGTMEVTARAHSEQYYPRRSVPG